MALGALTLARSRAQEKKLLPAITFTGERFVESGNDHASDTEVLVIALLVILFEPSPNETQERAALARTRTRAAQSGPAGRRRRRPPAPAAPGLLAVFSQRAKLSKPRGRVGCRLHEDRVHEDSGRTQTPWIHELSRAITRAEVPRGVAVASIARLPTYLAQPTTLVLREGVEDVECRAL